MNLAYAYANINKGEIQILSKIEYFYLRDGPSRTGNKVREKQCCALLKVFQSGVGPTLHLERIWAIYHLLDNLTLG